jgi:AraC-like DNA-binding protein
MTTTTQLTSVGSNALVAAVPDETQSSGWPMPIHREIGTLPVSRLRRVTDYIDAHLDHDLTLARLGAVVCMSPYHFARLFQRTTGLPPHRFVVRVRLEHATTLLASTELSIARIAQAVGFRTPSHFSTVFRRIMGVTPRAYRAVYLRAGLSHREEGCRDGME